MSEIWNLSTLCRCCHADGHFKSLKTSYQGENYVEIYEKMLQDTLGIAISTPPLDASYNICDKCIYELQVATKFKKQVLLCEQKMLMDNSLDYLGPVVTLIAASVALMKIPQNEQFLAMCDDIKSEENDDSDGIIDNDADYTQIDENFSLDVKKEYNIAVDIKNPIEVEVQKDVQPRTEKKIVDKKTNNDKTNKKIEVPKKYIRNRKSNATVKKQELTKNGEQPKKRINIDRSLIMQVDTETGTQFSCKDCGGLYQTEKDINQHLYKQHRTKYKCEHCPKQYKSFHCYKSHLATHTGNEFQCSYCKKTFAYKFAYIVHLNVHRREKIFQCDLCKNNFKYKSTLIRHLRIHAGTNESILCDLCGRSFTEKSNLNAHVRTVHLDTSRRYVLNF